MDLPPIRSQQTGETRPAKPDTRLVLDSLSNALVDTKISATVQKAVVLSETARQDQIDKLTTELSNVKQTPAQAKLEQLQQIIQSPRLYLLTARVDKAEFATAPSANTPLAAAHKNSPYATVQATATKTPTLPQNLQMLSTLLLPLKSSIQVKVLENGHLQLTQMTTSEKTQSTKPPIHPRETAQKSAENVAAFIKEKQTQIEAGLRQYLPYQQRIGQSDKVLDALLKTLVKIPNETRALIADKPLLKLLTTQASAHSIAAEKITAQTIQNAVNRSGSFFEAKLVNATAAQTSIQHAPASKPPSNPSPAIQSPAQSHTISTTVSGDKKATLLQIIDLPNRVLTDGTVREQSAQQTRPHAVSNVQQLLASAATQLRGFDALLSSLTSLSVSSTNPLPASLNIGDIRKQLSRILSAAAALGIARISSSQLQKLLAVANEGAPALQNTQVEFAVRMQEQLLPVSLYFQESKIDADEEAPAEHNKDKPDKAASRWQVFFELELPDYGTFAAEIVVAGNCVKTRLWAENSSLSERAKTRLNQLEAKFNKDGLNLEEIVIERGPPPQRNQQINHSLVDVRT